jgi:hypothetical protein
MTSKETLHQTLVHTNSTQIVIDFGSTPVTGIHVLAVERLREYYGLEKHPVKVVDPYQMLGEIEDDLARIIGCDVMGVWPRNNIFGVENTGWKEFRTFWGQVVLVPGMLNTRTDEQGDLLVFPEGDPEAPPSAKMPKASYFFDTIIRQEHFDENNLKLDDNLEEFAIFTSEDKAYWKTQAERVMNSSRGLLVNMGGTALGDIALVPAPWLKNPRGIRDISEWYMSTLLRMDLLHKIFDKQTDIAIENLKVIFEYFGNSIDVMYLCGTDFGTQDSQFCSPESFRELYLPYYKKMNDWIDQNTTWKTFKHSCGAIVPLLPSLIDAGFDIINPVQINASGMDSRLLKEEFGSHVTFWGGGIDTQKVLPFGTPVEVETQVLEQCEILGENGGFVFNAIHNIQANVPVENIVAMINALNRFNGK